MSQLPKILCVDDEPEILTAFKRRFRGIYDVSTAESGIEALSLVQKKKEFAVVISDLRMPGMDGITLLQKMRHESPDTVRILLTAFADLEVAMDAVNEGSVFRFLTKPCDEDVLKRAFGAAIKQYSLEVAEKVLLQKTLRGSIEVLSEILGLVNPAAFGRASRIQDHVEQLVKILKLKHGWQYELAAMLSQIGCLTLTAETLDKYCAGEELTPEEALAYSQHPEVGYRLLSEIPRLDKVAEIVRYQQIKTPYEIKVKTHDIVVILGVGILKATLALDKALENGLTAEEALKNLQSRSDEFEPRVLEALQSVVISQPELLHQSVPLDELSTRMTIAENVYAKNGLLLVGKGQRVTSTVITRLKGFGNNIGVVEPIRVWARE